MKKLLAFLFVFLFLAVALLLSPQEVDYAAQTPNGEYDRVIVKFRPLVPRRYKNKIVEGKGGLLAENLRVKDTYVVRVPKRQAGSYASNLQRNLFVEYAEEDFVAQAFEVPNDPEYPNQWGLTKIEASGAWDTTHGGSNVDIAIVDTGINSNHPDLAGKIVASVNCTWGSSCPSYTTSDPYGHGTHVAGITSALTNNSTGVAGISWEGRLMSVKVLSDSGSGYYSWVANGIYWATDNGAEVINLSLGGSSSSRTLRNAVNYAWNNGVVLVAAAGNRGWSYRSYPAYFSNVIAVAATDVNDNKAGFSNYGSWVDVAAPGVSVLSTYHGSYDYLSGTSMATPHVVGLAGLLFGQNPGWSNAQVRNQIENTSDAIGGTGSYWTHGRINACSAVGCGAGPSPTPVATPTNTPTPTNTSTPSPSPTPTATPSPTPTETVTPTPTPSPSPTPEATPTNTPTPTPTPTATVTVTPSPSPTPTPPLPWWCQYIPWHYTCQ